MDRTKVIGVPPPPAGWLIIRTGHGSGRDFRLAPETTVGRDAVRCDLILDDSTVSAEHARVRHERGQFVLYDMASTNGTFVNGDKVSRAPLYDGDVVKLGDVQLVFKEVKNSEP
jgi:pSer/pThr/pTyr-binding forkhead associated (FHA) protein